MWTARLGEASHDRGLTQAGSWPRTTNQLAGLTTGSNPMKSQSTTARFAASSALLGAVALVSPAWGHGIITPDPVLPPLGPPNAYVNPFAKYWTDLGGIRYCIANPIHTPRIRQSNQPIGPDEKETFGSTLDAEFMVFDPGGGLVAQGPLHLEGQTMTLVLDKVGNVTGDFETEMLSLDLTGTVLGQPLMIRESPTRASTGRTSIADVGGGLYQIDSFFDVFAELSLDGGATWLPGDGGPTRMELIPEAASGLLLGLGALGLTWWRRRR